MLVCTSHPTTEVRLSWQGAKLGELVQNHNISVDSIISISLNRAAAVSF